MSLSRRQAQAINQIILEEVQGAIKARRNRGELLRRGEIQERLAEAGPDPMRVDASIMDEQAETIAEEIAADMVDDLLYKFRQVFLRKSAAVLSRHGMSAVSIDPRHFADEVEEFDEDGVYSASMEATTDVRNALIKYAKDLGHLAVMMAGGREADEEEFEG